MSFQQYSIYEKRKISEGIELGESQALANNHKDSAKIASIRNYI